MTGRRDSRDEQDDTGQPKARVPKGEDADDQAGQPDPELDQPGHGLHDAGPYRSRSGRSRVRARFP